MPYIDRLQLARSTYRAALDAARARSTAVTWRRLVRAGQNLREVQLEARKMPQQPRAGATSRRTVLLVEDERDTREALRDVLVREGLTVWTAEDAPEALDYLQRARLLPSVILLDLVLPGMNGWELRAALLGDRALASIPVVAMTGARGAPVPGVRVFRKPFDVGDLVETVARVAGAR